MRILVLRTFSNSCDPIFRPLSKMGNQLVEITYDKWKRDEYYALPTYVKDIKPDWVLMLGCHEGNNALVPGVEILAEINRSYKLVHICCDGGDPVWWPQLERYNQYKAITLHVNIDGVKEGPFASFQNAITTLCPIDPGAFPDPPRPWYERPFKLGFRGSFNHGGNHPRTLDLQPMIDEGLVTFQDRNFGDYSEYVNFMSSCQCVLNHAVNGSGDRMHVKARVIEAALAGALLFESADSPTQHWFEPGDDYITYSDVDEVKDYLAWAVDLKCAHDIALSMRDKVLRLHSSKVFWNKIIDRLQ
jgi:hypothetical protein